MKTKSILAGLVGLSVVAGIPFAHAAGEIRVACKKELKSFKCGAATEQEAHKCLESHEAHDKKNDGFSQVCYEAHEAFEKKSGAEEKGEARE